MKQVFVLIDALGWRLAEREGFFAALLPHRAPLRTVLGYSSAAIPTLLTGLAPRDHGRWNLLARAEGEAPFAALRRVPRWLLAACDHRAGRRVFTAVGRRRLGRGFECAVAPALLPYFRWTEPGDIFAPGGLAPARSICDDWRAAGLPACILTYRDGSDRELIGQAQAALAGGANPVLLYLSELDRELHCRGTAPAAVAPVLDRYRAWLGGWFEGIVAAGGAVTVFSDHGMTAVAGSCDVAGAIAALGLRQPRDYLAVYDSTMARFWAARAGVREHLAAALAALPHGRLLADDELRREGVLFADRRYGEMIYLLDPGWIVARGDFNGRGWNPVAMHGYDPGHPDSDALFASSRPPLAPLATLAGAHGELRRPLAAAPPRPRPARPRPQPLRVLYFSNSLARGGAEAHWLGLLAGLDRERFRPYLICPPALARQIADEIPNDVPVATLLLRGPGHAAAAWRLARWIRRWRIDVLHSHLFFASLFASPIARALGVAAIVETPHLRESWRRGWKQGYAFDRVVGRSVDAWVAVSRANAEYLRRVKRLPPEKIVVIENGIDLERFAARPAEAAALAARLGLAAGDPVLLVPARLEPQKGHAVLLTALPALRRRFPRLRLICLGEGSLRAALEAHAAALGVAAAVEFVGYQARIEPWLALASVVVLPSWYEGLPLAVLEALAARRPVVATAVDGTVEAVISGRTGLTVPPGDAAALAEAVAQLLSAPAWAERLGTEGRRWVAAHFDRRRQIAATERLYRELWYQGRPETARALAAGAA